MTDDENSRAQRIAFMTEGFHEEVTYIIGEFRVSYYFVCAPIDQYCYRK